MDLVSLAIMVLWGGSILSRLGALVALIVRRLMTRYPALAITLLVGTIRSFVLVYVLLTEGQSAYVQSWIRSQPLSIALDCLLTIGAYVLMLRYAPKKVGIFAVALLGLFALVATGIVLGTAGLLWVPSRAPAIIATTRYYTAGCLLVLWLSYCAFRFYGYRFARNVELHVVAMSILFGGAAIASQLREFDDYWGTALGQFVLLGSAIAAQMMWAVCLKRSGETRPEGLPAITNGEYRAGEDAWKRTVRKTREAFRDHWHLPLF